MVNLSVPRFSPFFRSQALRSGGSAKPGWHVSKGQRWGPEIPDKQYFWDHPTYTGFVLWLRGVRPYAEKLAGDGFRAARYVVECGVNPIKNLVVRHNPDFRLVRNTNIVDLFQAPSFQISLRIVSKLSHSSRSISLHNPLTWPSTGTTKN